MPRQTRHARLLLARAAHAVLSDFSGCGAASRGVHYVDGGSPDGGTTGAPPAKPKEEPKKLELTEADVQARIDAALKAERDAAKTAKQQEDEAKAEEEARKKGEFEKLANDEKGKREKAEQKAADAERRAQLAEVNIQLRDHLAEKHPEYLSNAADIMLHVKEKLAADAKPEAVTKLIEEQAKAFVDRTPKSKGGSNIPAPTRSGVPRGADVPQKHGVKRNGNYSTAALNAF